MNSFKFKLIKTYDNGFQYSINTALFSLYILKYIFVIFFLISSYGINLENLEEDEYSDNGIIRCMVQSFYVGNQNISYIVSGQYGRSVPDKYLYHVSADNKIHMLQTYAGTTV